MSDHGDDYTPTPCPVCGADMEWADCWHCQGVGGFHDCGDDCCPCLDKDYDPDHDPPCCECNGEGGYLECTALPHTEEQIRAHRQAKEAT